MSDNEEKMQRGIRPDQLIDATIAALEELKKLGAKDLEIVVEAFPGLAIPAVGTGFGLRKSDKTKGVMKIFLSPREVVGDAKKNPGARVSTVDEPNGE